MIYPFALAAFLTAFSGCSDADDPVLTQKDWNNTTEYFASTDESKADTYYRPYVGYVGDPMPFYDPVAQDFKVLYLQDYRPNPADTYHPIWGVSTKDCSKYTSLGEVIPTGTAAEADAAIGTGSTIYNEADKLYYTFYTGHTSNREVVMVATSADFKEWTKNRTFYLRGADYGYSTTDFRDPFVFKGDDGMFHMLVSTKQGTKGVLAEFTSADLKAWNHSGVFMTMMWDRFYECPDVFKMGDWWYLIFSEFSDRVCTRYVMSKDLKTWTAPAADMFDGRGFYAAKSAGDGEKRYLFGWIPTKTNDRDQGGWEWGGSLAVHELYQRPDGTLGVRAPAQREAAFTEEAASDALTVRGTSGRTEEIGAMPHTYLLRCTLEGDFARAGFAVAHSAAAGYRYVVDTQNNTFSFENYPSADLFGDVTVPITPAQAYEIVLFVEGNVCTAYINGEKALSARTEGALGGAAGFYVQGGEASVGYTLLQPAA